MIAQPMVGLLLGRLAFAAGPSLPERIPVQVALVRAMEAGRVKVGDGFYAKVEAEWTSPNCKLRKGAILKGRIISENVRSKTARTSEIALLFESGECGGRDMKPLPLTVAAVIAPDPNLNASLYEGQESRPLSDAVGLAIGGGGGGSSGGVGGGGSLRSLSAAAATIFVEPPQSKTPKAVLPGQVVGIGDVKLRVGNGPEGSSVLSAAKHNLRLEAGSQFVLVPNVKPSDDASIVAANTTVAAANPPAAAADSAIAEGTSAADETEICSPPACNVVLAGSEETGPIRATATVSVRELGFRSEPNHEMYSFDHAAAIVYLGPKQILLTFNPHVLTPRSGAEASARKLHMVRAILVDLPTRSVQQIVDWRVHDAEQYLWPVGQDRVLVHVGRELRMYGPGLKLKQKLSLGGPLAFVRISPSGGYLAVGVTQERHSEAVHRQLVEAEDREPEEDLEVKVLDADFHALARVLRSSREATSVLTDEGEIRIPTIGKNRWRIVEHSWAGQRRVLAQVSSTCPPAAASVPPNLLFVVGCERQADDKWYRMLRPDGKPVLKGSSPSEELQQTASGVSNAFAIGIAKASKGIAAAAPFRSSDLVSQHIGVYRAGDGQRIFEVSVRSPEPTLQAFVLSPGGDQLAVLSGEQIALYAVPTAGDAHK
jgi:hypothetical protein